LPQVVIFIFRNSQQYLEKWLIISNKLYLVIDVAPFYIQTEIQIGCIFLREIENLAKAVRSLDIDHQIISIWLCVGVSQAIKTAMCGGHVIGVGV
jgi:hypothetical protein